MSLSNLWKIAKTVAFMVGAMVLFGLQGFGETGRKRRRIFLRNVFLAWSRFCMRTFGVKLKVEGHAFFPQDRNRPIVLLCNHQSQLDIPILVLATESVLGFVAKKELTRFPILAYWIRQIGCIPIDRSDRNHARKSLEKGAEILAAPRIPGIDSDRNPIVVFPEGTRSKTGQLLPIRMGGIRMAIMAKALVVPVYIQDSRKAFEARLPSHSPWVPVKARIFPSLDTENYVDEKASWLQVKEHLEKCWKEAETSV